VSLAVVVEADGGSRGNPGPAGYGAVVLDEHTDAVLAERAGWLGVATNNVAEYRGLIAGLEAAVALGATEVSVRMDSKLVVEQMAGRWQVKHPGLQPLARRAQQLCDGFAGVGFEWIPRERNVRADALANQAMDSRDEIVVDHRPALAPSWAPPTGIATRLVLVRHGSTIHSAQRRLSGRNELPLTVEGNAQARALAERMSKLKDVAAVIASPLRRARETAAHIAAAVALDVTIESGFQEVDFGQWEGRTFAEIAQSDAAALTAWSGSPHATPPGGESFAQLGERLRAARDRVFADYPGRTVIIVSHVTPIKLLLVDSLGAPLDSLYRVFLDPASVSIVDHPQGRASSVSLINGTSHLIDDLG
jgi:broad specificity phosphatase PhoE/ribonuclease HI